MAKASVEHVPGKNCDDGHDGREQYLERLRSNPETEVVGFGHWGLGREGRMSVHVEFFSTL